MSTMIGNNEILGAKRITELNPLYKLQGKEQVLIDNGVDTYKVTVDTLLGYIANQINAGNIPSTPTEAATNIVVIKEGESIPVDSRLDGTFYLEIQGSRTMNRTLSSRIRVSPNMGLKLVND